MLTEEKKLDKCSVNYNIVIYQVSAWNVPGYSCNSYHFLKRVNETENVTNKC
jgi:hypothetical protein